MNWHTACRPQQAAAHGGQPVPEDSAPWSLAAATAASAACPGPTWLRSSCVCRCCSSSTENRSRSTPPNSDDQKPRCRDIAAAGGRAAVRACSAAGPRGQRRGQPQAAGATALGPHASSAAWSPRQLITQAAGLGVPPTSCPGATCRVWGSHAKQLSPGAPGAHLKGGRSHPREWVVCELSPFLPVGSP